MKTRNNDHPQQEGTKKEISSQEEILNLDELFDVQGGIDDKQQDQLGGCGLGCFTGSTTYTENPGGSTHKDE